MRERIGKLECPVCGAVQKPAGVQRQWESNWTVHQLVYRARCQHQVEGVEDGVILVQRGVEYFPDHTYEWPEETKLELWLWCGRCDHPWKLPESVYTMEEGELAIEEGVRYVTPDEYGGVDILDPPSYERH